MNPGPHSEQFKQLLRIKRFFINSENTANNRIWIAISGEALVSILKKCFDLNAILYTILQVSGASAIEKISPLQMLSEIKISHHHRRPPSQLNLFD